MQPLFETIDDRRWQWAICDAYAHTRGLELRMTDQRDVLPWDVEFLKAGKVVAIAEVKRRHVDRLKYATYKIDKSKVDAMLNEARLRTVTCGILVEFNDGRFKQSLSQIWLHAHATVSVIHRKNRAGETPDDAWEWSNELWSPL